jgi:hypothetical protein
MTPVIQAKRPEPIITPKESVVETAEDTYENIDLRDFDEF